MLVSSIGDILIAWVTMTSVVWEISKKEPPNKHKLLDIAK